MGWGWSPLLANRLLCLGEVLGEDAGLLVRNSKYRGYIGIMGKKMEITI